MSEVHFPDSEIGGLQPHDLQKMQLLVLLGVLEFHLAPPLQILQLPGVPQHAICRLG